MKAARLSFVIASCLLLILIQLTIQTIVGASPHSKSYLQSGGNGAPNDPNIAYIGRWDTTGLPSLIRGYWAGSYFKVQFTGTSVAVKIAQSVNFYFKIDSGPDTLRTSASGTVMLAQSLPSGTHSLRVATRAEFDVMRFQGLVLDPGAVTLPATTSSQIVEFVGDSITVGNRASKIALSSYAWLTGENLSAEHTDIAYTGVCLVDGVPCGSTTGMSRGILQSANDQLFGRSPVGLQPLSGPDCRDQPRHERQRLWDIQFDIPE
jgi:hypothetical protein